MRALENQEVITKEWVMDMVVFNSPLLKMLPFKSITGNCLIYNQECTHGRGLRRCEANLICSDIDITFAQNSTYGQRMGLSRKEVPKRTLEFFSDSLEEELMMQIASLLPEERVVSIDRPLNTSDFMALNAMIPCGADVCVVGKNVRTDFRIDDFTPLAPKIDRIPIIKSKFIENIVYFLQFGEQALCGLTTPDGFYISEQKDRLTIKLFWALALFSTVRIAAIANKPN